MAADPSQILTDAIGGAGVGSAVATPGLGTAAGAAIGAAGGLLAFLYETGQDQAAADIQKKAQAAFGNVSDAAVKAAAAQVLGPTKLAQIQTDPRYRAAQDNALASLSRISQQGGYTLADRANLQNTQDSNSAEASSNERGVLAGLARRGMAGTGAEEAAALSGGQAAANRNSQAGLQIAANGQDRALKAIMDQGALGGQIQQQDFNQKAQVANAQDAIDKFNNTSQYDRAADAYNRQIGQVGREYGMASDQAGNVRAAGDKAGGYIAGASRAVDQAATGASRAPGSPATPGAAPAAPAAPSTDTGTSSAPLTDPTSRPAMAQQANANPPPQASPWGDWDPNASGGYA